MHIDFAQNADIAAWLALVRTVQSYFPGLETTAYEKQLRAFIRRREALRAADASGLWGALLFSREAQRIEFLAVDPSRRREGIAARLLQNACAQFPPGTCLRVATYREADPLGIGARRFYAACGFTAGKWTTEFSYPCQEFFYTVE